jgi:hypothetical protein
VRRLIVAGFIIVAVISVTVGADASVAAKKSPPRIDAAGRAACFQVLTLNFDRSATPFNAEYISNMVQQFEKSKTKGAKQLGKRFDSVTGPTVAYNTALTDASNWCVKYGIDTRAYSGAPTP